MPMNSRLLASILFLFINIAPAFTEASAIPSVAFGDRFGFSADNHHRIHELKPANALSEQWFRDASFRPLKLALRFRHRVKPQLSREVASSTIKVVKRTPRFLFFPKSISPPKNSTEDY